MGSKVGKKCPRCGKKFQIGWNGVVKGGISMCDKCASIERDENGDIVWTKEIATTPALSKRGL